MAARLTSARKLAVAAAFLAAGAIGGGFLTLATSASADPTPTASSSSSSEAKDANKSSETALTGDTLAKVKEAVLAKYPNATFIRVETDSDGVYEAHITTAAGENVTVEVDKSFAVTGTETNHGHGGRHGRGGNGETALTGDTLTKVKDAVSAKYPNATFERVETDADGVYEAHITTSGGDQITVEVDKSFAVTGTE